MHVAKYLCTGATFCALPAQVHVCSQLEEYVADRLRRDQLPLTFRLDGARRINNLVLRGLFLQQQARMSSSKSKDAAVGAAPAVAGYSLLAPSVRHAFYGITPVSKTS